MILCSIERVSQSLQEQQRITKALQKQLEASERASEARALSTSADGLSSNNPKKLKRTARRANVASSSAKSLLSTLDGANGGAREVEFLFNNPCVGKFGARRALDQILSTLLFGAPTQDSLKQYIESLDSVICGEVSSGKLEESTPGTVSVPSLLAQGEFSIDLSSFEGVPRHLLEVSAEGALHPALPQVDTIFFVETFVQVIDWADLETASGRIRSSNFTSRDADSLEVRRRGVRESLIFPDSTVVQELDGRMKALLKVGKERFSMTFLRLFGIKAAEKGRSFN